MALPLSVDYETSYSDEDAIGVTGGDGDAWDGGFDGTGITCTADTDVVPPDTECTVAMRWDMAATVSTGNRFWDTSIGDVDNMYMTFAFYRNGAISTNMILAQMQASTGSPTRAQLRYNSTANTISIRRQFTVWDTTTETIADQTWYYMQWHVYGNSSGSSEFKLYDADQSLLETINNSSGTGDFGGQIGRMRIGPTSAPTASMSFWLSGVDASGTAYPALPALPVSGFTGWGVPILG